MVVEAFLVSSRTRKEKKTRQGGGTPSKRSGGEEGQISLNYPPLGGRTGGRVGKRPRGKKRDLQKLPKKGKGNVLSRGDEGISWVDGHRMSWRVSVETEYSIGLALEKRGKKKKKETSLDARKWFSR